MSMSSSNLLPKNAAGSQHHEHQQLQPFAEKTPRGASIMSISSSNLLPKNAAGSQHHEHQQLRHFAEDARGSQHHEHQQLQPFAEKRRGASIMSISSCGVLPKRARGSQHHEHQQLRRFAEECKGEPASCASAAPTFCRKTPRGASTMSMSSSNLLPKNAAGSQHHEHQQFQPFAEKRRAEPAS